jgi:uncharacterized membrane protein (DUF106 family)
MIDNPSHYITATVAAVASSIVGAGVWLVRTILTDTKRLSLLEQRQDLQHREMVMALRSTQDQVEKMQTTNAMSIASQRRIVEMLAHLEQGKVDK